MNKKKIEELVDDFNKENKESPYVHLHYSKVGEVEEVTIKSNKFSPDIALLWGCFFGIIIGVSGTLFIVSII
jgi:hypothetical protein